MPLRHSFAISLLVCVTGTWLYGAPERIYVSPGGDDRWSGRIEAPSPSRDDGPKATLEAALELNRNLRQKGQAPDGVNILLRGGRHELRQPLHLGPDDSGPDAKRRLEISSFADEVPVITGGRRITGWRKVDGQENLWEAEIADVRAGRWSFRQLFVNGERRQRARTPNEGFFRIQGSSPQTKPMQIHFQPGEIKPGWAADGEVEVVALLAWSDIRMQIRSVDTQANVATLSGEPRPSNQEANARYYIENAPDGLDAPGEWYLNRATGIVRYLAKPGEDLNALTVVAPKLQELISISGDFGKQRPVSHLYLHGLTFSETDWDLGPQGYADTQAAVAIHGDIRAQGAVDCRIENCRFVHLAGYALELGRGCQRVHVVGNEMIDLGAGGIRIGETAASSSAFEQNHGHVITDNHLQTLGRIYAPAIGVFVMQSGSNRIAHNHIHDLYYTAISVGWNWGYQETPCRENIVEFNHLHDIGQAMLSDMGAIYTLGIQKGTVIRNNLIHDVNSFTYGGWGLYPDEGSTDIVWEKNVVYRTKSAGFHQHYGRENVVRNNIFAFGKEHQLMRTRNEPHLSFLFFNNLIYFESGDLLGSSWDNDRYLSDFNLFFDTRLGAEPDTLKFGGDSLAVWRGRGHDVHSVVADPLFRAPEKGDFHLREKSPAFKLGFQQINLDDVGVRAPADRELPPW